MIDGSSLYFIKSNLQVINYASAIISFIIGISPLLMNREAVEKSNKPFLIELSAAFFLIFTLLLIFLDFVAYKPFFKKHDCIILKDKYENQLEFHQYHKRKLLKILEIGSDNYFLKNIKTSDTLELDIKNDYQYKKTNCL